MLKARPPRNAGRPMAAESSIFLVGASTFMTLRITAPKGLQTERMQHGHPMVNGLPFHRTTVTMPSVHQVVNGDCCSRKTTPTAPYCGHRIHALLPMRPRPETGPFLTQPTSFAFAFADWRIIQTIGWR